MQDVTLKLESIRDDFREKYWHHVGGRLHMGASEIKGAKSLMGMRPFVKEIVGVDRNGRTIRRGLKGKKSYVEARTPTGSRGVAYWFTLRQGCCYLVQEQVSRTATRRYFVIVANGALHEVDERQAADYVASTSIVAVEPVLPCPR